MKKYMLWVSRGILLGALVVGMGWMNVHAGEEEHSLEGHGKAEKTKTDFDDYSDAIAAIDEHREHVEELIEEKKLAEIHKAAKPIQLISKHLNKLAFKDDSGVPREKLKEINLTSKALAKTWAKIDEAGDAGDLAGTKKVYHEMVELINTLKKYMKPGAVKNAHDEHKDGSGHEEDKEENQEEERGHHDE